MRITREKVAENREHLLQVAADQFRQKGIDDTGLNDLTKAAGMKLGSFYAYFDSKEQLVTESCAREVGDIKNRLLRYLTKPSDAPYDEMVDMYLSPRHRDSRAKGCVLAALGSELTHQPEAVRHAATDELKTLFSTVADHLPGATAAAREDLAITTMVSLMGGLILSRLADDPTLAQRILDATAASLKQQNKENHHGKAQR